MADKLMQQMFVDQCLPEMDCLKKVLNMEQREEYISPKPCHTVIHRDSERELFCISKGTRKKW